MKKMIGAAIANWLRKPANREKAKQSARRAYDSFQERKSPDSPPKR